MSCSTCGNSSATNGVCTKCTALNKAIIQEGSKVAIGAIIPNVKVIRVESNTEDSLSHPEPLEMTGATLIGFNPPSFEHESGPSISSVFIGGTFTISLIMVVWFALGLDANPISRLKEMVSANSAQATSVKLPVGHLKSELNQINSSGKIFIDGTQYILSSASGKKGSDTIEISIKPTEKNNSFLRIILILKFKSDAVKNLDSLQSYLLEFDTLANPTVIKSEYSKRLAKFGEISRLSITNSTISAALDGEQKVNLNNRSTNIRWHLDLSSQLLE